MIMKQPKSPAAEPHCAPVTIMGRDKSGNWWIIDVPPGAPIPSKDDLDRIMQPRKLPVRRRPSLSQLRLHHALVRAGRE